MKYYEINEQLARASHDAMSMSDYPVNSATSEYRAAVDAASRLVEAQKVKVSPYYHEKLDGLLDAYARRLAAWTNDHNRNGASCPSVMISGSSNFPAGKKQKQISRENTLMREYGEIRNLLDRIRSTGTGPIDFADPNARELLQERLDAAKANQERMKSANAWYRKHKTLDGCPGLTQKELSWITRPGVYNTGDGSPLALHKKPFPDFELQSGNAAIKRYAARLAEYDKLHSTGRDGAGEAGTEFDGGQIVRNIEQNRLQILFDEIPDETTRQALKSRGFRWSPRNQAWQRQLTQNAELDAKQILGIS